MEFLKGLERQAIAQGKLENIPDALTKQPKPSQWNSAVWEAFNRLSSSRQWTMGGPAAIPFSEIKAYFDIYHIEDMDEREDFIYVIQALDNAYIEHAAKKAENK